MCDPVLSNSTELMPWLLPTSDPRGSHFPVEKGKERNGFRLGFAALTSIRPTFTNIPQLDLAVGPTRGHHSLHRAPTNRVHLTIVHVKLKLDPLRKPIRPEIEPIHRPTTPTEPGRPGNVPNRPREFTLNLCLLQLQKLVILPVHHFGVPRLVLHQQPQQLIVLVLNRPKLLLGGICPQLQERLLVQHGRVRRPQLVQLLPQRHIHRALLHQGAFLLAQRPLALGQLLVQRDDHLRVFALAFVQLGQLLLLGETLFLQRLDLRVRDGGQLKVIGTGTATDQARRAVADLFVDFELQVFLAQLGGRVEQAVVWKMKNRDKFFISRIFFLN